MQIGARTSGGIIKFTVTTGGTEYLSPPDVVLIGGGGTGAQAQAHLAGGRVQSVVVLNAGTGYTDNPTVTIAAKSVAATIASVTAVTDSSTVTFTESIAALTWPDLVAATTAPIVSWENNTQAVVASTGLSAGAVTLTERGRSASVQAYAATGPLEPMTFFRGRFNEVYGVDGLGRGVRYTLPEIVYAPDPSVLSSGGESIVAENESPLSAVVNLPQLKPIGLHKPAVGPVISSSTSTGGRYVSAIQMVRGGGGYAGIPNVALVGGDPERNAKARAVVLNGRVDRIFITDQGAGYQTTPTVEITGGVGAGATFDVSLLGAVTDVRVLNAGTGYTSNLTGSPVTVTIAGQGLTGAAATAIVNPSGKIGGIVVTSAGTGATTTGATAVVQGGGGTGAELAVDLVFRVSALSVGNSGSGYYTPPVITIRRQPTDTETSAATAEAEVANGHVTAAAVRSGGRYTEEPEAFVDDSSARAQATLRDLLRGAYVCCIRYFDDTPAEQNGPMYSSISDLTTVDCGDGANELTWSFKHYGLDERVVGMELWRSSSDQQTILFRVATIKRTDPEWEGTYTDSIDDLELPNSSREGYGLMPITLPSGQINARRFEVPPGEFSVACMFQDRAWYAVDSLGIRPNALYFSEIDEPESVSDENELLVQENGSTPDKIVALVPLGPSLLVVQQAHLYKLMYVAQPIIDASITLSAYRGALNSRCWSVMMGVAFLADSNGVYAYDGQREEAISAAIDDKWRDGSIDFSKSDKFSVTSDFLTKTVRFHYCRPEDSEPVRALCYCVATQAWWEESRPHAIRASASLLINKRVRNVDGLANGQLTLNEGLSDQGTAIPYSIRTGPMPLDDGPSRSVAVVYKPTPSVNPLNLSLHYNNSSTPRPNAISTDRGSGFVSAQGGTAAVLDMAATRSQLADANGFARAYVAGRKDDRSAGGDRHLAIAMAGTQSSTNANDGVVIYSIQAEGVS